MSAAALVQGSASLVDAAVLQQRVSQLPALPRAAMEALAVLRDDRAGSDECARRVAQDQALTARTLQLANSAFYGVPGRVSSIGDAIQLLGRRTLRAVLTTVTVSTQFKKGTVPGFDFDGFWRHCIGTAIASEAVATALALDQELAFTAGLLHDVGRLALVAFFPQEMSAALQHARSGDLPLRQAEIAVLHTDHAGVGATVASRWNFPAAVVDAIASHHAPDTSAPGVSMACVVHVADAIVHALDLTGDEREMVPDISLAAWERLALSPQQCLAIFKHTQDGVDALSQALATQ